MLCQINYYHTIPYHYGPGGVMFSTHTHNYSYFCVEIFTAYYRLILTYFITTVDSYVSDKCHVCVKQTIM